MTSLIRNCVKKMSAYVPGEQPSDLNVIKLNTNENPYPPSPAVRQALKRIDGDWLRRYPDPESIKLRTAIARLHNCRLSQVFVGNGSDEILALCSRAFVEDNGLIAFFEPSYSLYPVLARIRAVKSLVIRLSGDFQWRMPSGCRASLFYLTNPNAPTGMLYPKKEVQQFCKRFAGVVVLDEAYVDFARANCVDLALKLKNTLVLRSLSKSYSLAGLRVGYAIGSEELISALFKIKDSYNLDRVAQCLAQAAIEDQRYMRANVRRIIATRKEMSSALQKMGFLVFPSETNFLWVKPRGLTTDRLYRQLRKHNILVRYFTGLRTRAYLRITVGTKEQTRKFLQAVTAILKRDK